MKPTHKSQFVLRQKQNVYGLLRFAKSADSQRVYPLLPMF